MRYIILIFASLYRLALADSRIDLLVSTKLGQIRGLRDENGYTKFLGVPYGKVGSNVFGAAEPYPEFEDIFEAYDDSNICTQLSYGSQAATGSNDCLNMNIYVPDNADSNNRLPVMVWIHGGGFTGGSAIREAGNSHFLLRHDVIVVAINYRLGVFGFMCLDIPEVPGNTGLKDQALALRWINQNIESFGGDPSQITVFGQSAGGMAINLHLFSLNEQLFHRAIIESGAANSYWTIVKSDNSVSFRIAAYLGFNTTDIYEALSFLTQENEQIVAQVAYELGITRITDTIQSITKPCVEKEFDGVEHFLTEHPMNMKSNKASTTSIIIGYNNNELAFAYGNGGPEFFDSYDFNYIFSLGFNMENGIFEAMEDIKHFYLGDEDTSERVSEELTNFGSDFIFNHPTQRMAEKFLESGGQNVYYYEFSYDSISNGRNKTWSGAGRGDELPYLFASNQEERSDEDQIMTDVMTGLWTNFAKYGNPTPTTSELLPVEWVPITKTSLPYLSINLDLSLQSRPFHDRMAFWSLFYELNGHYQKWYKA